MKPSTDQLKRLQKLAGILNEGMAFNTKEEAIAYAAKESTNGYIQHVQDMNGHFVVDDWYDHETTIASFEGGNQINEISADILDPAEKLKKEEAFNEVLDRLVKKQPVRECVQCENKDHEVSMGQNSLDTIVWAANELKKHLGNQERDLPAWIQDHIAKAENYITQAAQNFHDYEEEEYDTDQMFLESKKKK